MIFFCLFNVSTRPHFSIFILLSLLPTHDALYSRLAHCRKADLFILSVHHQFEAQQSNKYKEAQEVLFFHS